MSFFQALPAPTPDSVARFRENVPFSGNAEDLVLLLRRDWETPRDLTRDELAGMINLENYKSRMDPQQVKMLLHVTGWFFLSIVVLLGTDSLVGVLPFVFFYFLLKSRKAKKNKRLGITSTPPQKQPKPLLSNQYKTPTSFNMLLLSLDPLFVPPRFRKYAEYLKSKWQEMPVGFKPIMTMEEFHWSIASSENLAGQNGLTSGTWDDTFSTYRGIVNEFTDYSMDILKILHKPLILDMSSNFTRNFHLSLNHAKQVEPLPGIAFDPDHPFIKLVGELKFNWDALLAEAEKVNLSNFSPDETAGIERAKKMMAIALDTSTTSAERQLAYRRAMKELEGLLLVPQTAVLELEKLVGLRSIGGNS